MLNFVVFHLFPVLDVLANDIRVTSGEPGKSWVSVLPALLRTLMSDCRNEMLPLRQDVATAGRINIHLSLLFQRCFTGDYVAEWCQSFNDMI